MNIFEKTESNVRYYRRACLDVFGQAKDSILYSETWKAYINFFAGAAAVQADIHLITSVEEDIESGNRAFVTNEAFMAYKGSGAHASMLAADHIGENAKIINAILRSA